FLAALWAKTLKRLKEENDQGRRVYANGEPAAHSKSYNPKLRGITHRARAKILEFAERHGSVTNEQAKKLGGWDQCYYHLAEMAKQGLLVHSGYNLWKPAGRRKSSEPAYSLAPAHGEKGTKMIKHGGNGEEIEMIKHGDNGEEIEVIGQF